ncbi:MAG: DUF1553 domain-containing protein [Aureliella sp.]
MKFAVCLSERPTFPANATFTLLVWLCLSPIGWAEDPLRFDRDVRPILSDKCFHCHGPDAENREADLRLDLEDAAKDYAITPGDAGDSMLMHRILSDDPETIMPPPASKKEMTSEEIDILRRWIQQGAQWSGHWAFEPLQPIDENATVPLSEQIDKLVAAQWEEHGLTPNPVANPEVLLRRITLDLTGLPPTPDEVDAFLADQQPGAWQRVVDRLLSSPHFGERMAIPWLDAARYGDTSVYHADGPRDMWAWRDAIVQAYNDNMRFDDFSIRQLAGDLLPDATLNDKVLSGFNRNNGTTDEGGAIAEEYRVEYAVDRVKTTATTWLGLTMECAQCHDHKYDPITQREYYQFYAFFNVSADGGMQTRKGNATPKVDIPNVANEKPLAEAKQSLVSTKAKIEQRLSESAKSFEEWLAGAGRNNPPAPALPKPIASALLADLKEKQLELEGSSPDLGDGAVHGPVKTTESPLGQAIEFRGKTWIDLGGVGDFEKDQAFALSGWIRPQGGVGAVLAKMDDANGFRGYDLYAGAGPVSMHIIHNWPGNAIKVTTKKKLTKNKWHHVLASYDGSMKASGIKIFVDGELWDWKIEQDGLTGSTQTDKTLLIGSRHPGSRFQGDIARVQVFDRALDRHAAQVLASATALSIADGRPPELLSEQQRETLRRHFLSETDPAYQRLSKALSKLNDRIARLEQPLTSVMVMGDQMKPRDTFVLNRGAYDQPTDELVEPATPSALPPMDDGLPRNRLGLAKWLFAEDNPLTARVAVNRYWQMLFGTGLVDTPSDFGAQGSFPSHPELLDRLAAEFRHSGWDIKYILKQIVLSETYRRSSRGKESYAADPTNRWLSRGARFRLQGEFVRDLALAVGGILDPKLGGPGVKPYQPPGLWAEVGLGGNPKFKQDHGQKLYRRSLYTYWKRSAPPPSMQIFDAPTREKCTLQRPRTNTPLQAFVTLNDPQFVEASRCMAERVLAQDLQSDNDRIAFAYRLATARDPSAQVRRALRLLLDDLIVTYRESPDDAKDLINVGESEPSGIAATEILAAYTTVCNAIINLDESLTRE